MFLSSGLTFRVTNAKPFTPRCKRGGVATFLALCSSVGMNSSTPDNPEWIACL